MSDDEGHDTWMETETVRYGAGVNPLHLVIVFLMLVVICWFFLSII